MNLKYIILIVLVILIPDISYYVKVTSLTTTNKTVNITAKSNLQQDILEGKLLFILPNSTKITANYDGNGTWWAVHTFDKCIKYKVNAYYNGRIMLLLAMPQSLLINFKQNYLLMQSLQLIILIKI